MPTAKLTKTFCDTVALPDGKGSELFWDTELAGFGLKIGRQSKSFIVQRGGKNRATLGRYGLITVQEARELARQKLAEISVRGYSPGPKITLGQAVELHAERMRRKGCAPRSVYSLYERIDRYLPDWKSRPLAEITRQEVRERHTRVGKKHGTYAANNAMRAFRSSYNTALKEYDLPQNPAIAVHWFKEYRRQEPVADLTDWYRKVLALENPVRRDYQLFVLFTGLRRRDAATVRWAEIDLQHETLHRPNPKGGPDRAFTIPLSRYLIELLLNRRSENQKLFRDTEWVFPTRRRDRTVTHIQEPKEKHLPSPHRLRDTFHTACQEAGLSPYDIDVLTNHRPPLGSVSAGYIRQSEDHLRRCQETVTAYLIERIGSPEMPFDNIGA